MDRFLHRIQGIVSLTGCIELDCQWVRSKHSVNRHNIADSSVLMKQHAVYQLTAIVQMGTKEADSSLPMNTLKRRCLRFVHIDEATSDSKIPIAVQKLLHSVDVVQNGFDHLAVVIELILDFIWLVTAIQVFCLWRFLGNAGKLESSRKPLVIPLTLYLFAGENKEKIALFLKLICLSSTISRLVLSGAKKVWK